MEPTLEETPQESGFRFSTRTLLWAITLLGVGMGAFGPRFGIYLSFLVLLSYRLQPKVKSRWRGIFEIAISFLVLDILFGVASTLLMPAVTRSKVGVSVVNHSGDEVLSYIIHWGRIGSTLLFVALAILPLWKRKARRADRE